MSRGGNLGGLEGRSPQSLKWGTAHAFFHPNILRSSVVSCARKYEKSKKGVFLVRKGLCTICNKVKIRKIREKRGKIRKTWPMTKTRSSEIFAGKMKLFQKKTTSWSVKNLSFPPNSAPGFRHWL